MGARGGRAGPSSAEGGPDPGRWRTIGAVLIAPGLPEIVLERPSAADADVIADLCQDPAIQAWTTVPVPYTRTDALEFLATVERGAVDRSALTWAIRVNGALVGMIGLDMQPAGSAEIGYWLAPAARGRGVMARAVAAVVDHAFAPDGLALDRLLWQAFVGNWRSRTVAERAGFVIEGTVRGQGLQRGVRRDSWVGTLLRADWDTGRSGDPLALPITRHLLLWTGLDSRRSEACEVQLSSRAARPHAGPADLRRLVAQGSQLGADPLPYRLDYRLWTGRALVTRRLDAVVTGQGWRRHLDLRRADDGTWSCDVDQDGAADLPAPGGDVRGLADALDCDLAWSPLTNTMPVLRHGLNRTAGAVDLTMAWVSVPDLGVHVSPQRYEHVSVEGDGGATVRYVGDGGAFVRDLVLDADGFVVRYPDLAERVDAGGGPIAARRWPSADSARMGR